MRLFRYVGLLGFRRDALGGPGREQHEQWDREGLSHDLLTFNSLPRNDM